MVFCLLSWGEIWGWGGLVGKIYTISTIRFHHIGIISYHFLYLPLHETQLMVPQQCFTFLHLLIINERHTHNTQKLMQVFFWCLVNSNELLLTFSGLLNPLFNFIVAAFWLTNLIITQKAGNHHILYHNFCIHANINIKSTAFFGLKRFVVSRRSSSLLFLKVEIQR